MPKFRQLHQGFQDPSSSKVLSGKHLSHRFIVLCLCDNKSASCPTKLGMEVFPQEGRSLFIKKWKRILNRIIISGCPAHPGRHQDVFFTQIAHLPKQQSVHGHEKPQNTMVLHRFLRIVGARGIERTPGPVISGSIFPVIVHGYKERTQHSARGAGK